QKVQNCGSGADLAAAVFGGIIAIRGQGKSREVMPLKLQSFPEISLYYCGYKMPTTEVISKVAKIAIRNKFIFNELYECMGSVSEDSIGFFEKEDWNSVGLLFNVYHGLLDALGVCDLVLSQMVYNIRLQGQAAKITGSGLGDCVIALGNVTINNYEKIFVKISKEGCCEQATVC
ncbi:MAG: mevalonate kinase family protein, partial [Lentisphaeria bacterium]